MKGIREYTNARFVELLPQLPELGNAGFRKAVMQGAITAFGISVASAATHYNFALKTQRATSPKSVAGLGRPEDKKGGRKPIHVVDVIKVKTGEVVASGISRDAANLLITKAAASRKAKLAIKEPVAEVAPVAEAAVEAA